VIIAAQTQLLIFFLLLFVQAQLKRAESIDVPANALWNAAQVASK
jgi:hypothetical protein